jgi:hypothetical protein
VPDGNYDGGGGDYTYDPSTFDITDPTTWGDTSGGGGDPGTIIDSIFGPGTYEGWTGNQSPPSDTSGSQFTDEQLTALGLTRDPTTGTVTDAAGQGWSFDPSSGQWKSDTGASNVPGGIPGVGPGGQTGDTGGGSLGAGKGGPATTMPSGGGVGGQASGKQAAASSSLGNAGQSSSLGGTGNALGSVVGALGGLAGPALTGLGLSNTGSLNPAANYGKGQTQTNTTMVGTDPNAAGAGGLGQLFNAYTQGAALNQTNQNTLLGGPNGIMSTLGQFTTNPVQDFGGGANEYTTLGKSQQLAAGPTALGQFATQGYQNAFQNPQSPYDVGAAGVYGAAAGTPSQTAQDLYAATQKYGALTGADQAAAEAKYKQMLTQGYDPATAQAIIQSALEGARAPFANQAVNVENQALATNNPLVAAVGGGGLAAQQAKAMSDAGRQAQIAIGQQAIQSGQTGAAGLSNLQALENAKQQFALGSQQSQLGQQQQYGLAGAGGLENLGQNIFGRQMTALGGTAAQNQQQVAQQMAANQQAQDWYNQMFGRRTVGVQGQTGLFNTLQGGGLGYLGGATNVGTRPTQGYTQYGQTGINSAGGANAGGYGTQYGGYGSSPYNSPYGTTNTGNIDQTTGLPYGTSPYNYGG